MKTITLGIVQGLTEFLPISSSGHLQIIKRFFNLEQSLLSFFVLLHLATLLAIVIFLRREIVQTLFKKNILIQLGIITIITAAIGLIINRFLTDFFGNKLLVACLLLVNGIILLNAKKVCNGRPADSLALKDSLFLGLLQGLAIFPGISRSGITIVGLLKRGFQPREAFSLSFLMAIPAIIGAFLFKAKELANLNFSAFSLSGGFLAAFISGLIALTLVRKMLWSQKFAFFGYYCILASVASLAI